MLSKEHECCQEYVLVQWMGDTFIPFVEMRVAGEIERA